VHHGNVGDPDDCLRVVHEVIGRYGRLDILVNNAGVTVDRAISVMSVDDGADAGVSRVERFRGWRLTTSSPTGSTWRVIQSV
jgi:NAD(P)-dependent dehydrogenase (short-subunit alcohol dehydrogenase family)